MEKRRSGARQARPFSLEHHVDAPGEPQAGIDAKRDAESVWARLRGIILAEAADIVLAAVEKAKEGQYQGMKYLFEMAGIYPAVAPEHERKDEMSLARSLCDRLGLPELEDAGQDAGTTSKRWKNADAVK